MPYIDKVFFATYSSQTIPDADLSKLIDRAADIIDALTMDKIGGDAGFATLVPDTQVRIQKAVAAQVEMLYAQGGLDALTDAGANSISLGKFSESKAPKGTAGPSDLKTFNGVPIHPLVYSYLRPTGALCRAMRQVLPRVPLTNRISLNDDDQYY
jgi:hypothetical protein